VTKWYIYRKRGVLALLGDSLVVQSCFKQSRLSTHEKNSISSLTSGLIFFRTPHGGSRLAGLRFNLVRLHSLLVFKAVVDCIKELRVESKILQDLSFDFRFLQDQYSILPFAETKTMYSQLVKRQFLTVIQAFH
jgi:hypothetical protein